MNILICDDEDQYIYPLEQHIHEFFSERQIPCKIDITTNPEAIWGNTYKYDIAFLDIQMGYHNGISLAKELQRRNKNTVLFFITNFDEFQDDAMDIRAFRFFTKPFDPIRLENGLNKALEHINDAYVDVYLPGDNGLIRILVDDILYLTRDNRKTILVTKENSIPVRMDFDATCSQLPSHFFFLIHKSFFVNVHHIQQYTYSEVIISGGIHLPVAPRKRAQFHKFWFEYLKRR